MESKNKTNRLLELIKAPIANVSPIAEWEQEQNLIPEMDNKTLEISKSKNAIKNESQNIDIQAYIHLLSTKLEERYNLGEAIRIDEEAQNFVKFLTNYLNLKHPGKKFYLGEVFSNIVKLHRNDYLEVIKEAKLDYLGL